MDFVKYFLLIIGFVGLGECFKFSANSCPSAVGKANFDSATFFSKSWYEMFRYPNANQTEDGCSMYTFASIPTYSMTYIKQRIVNNVPQDTVNTIVVPFTMANPSVGVLSSTWPWSSADLVVLDTDYTSYAVLYSCTSQFMSSKTEYAWVLQIATAAAVNIDYGSVAAESGVTINPAALIPTFQNSPCAP